MAPLEMVIGLAVITLVVIAAANLPGWSARRALRPIAETLGLRHGEEYGRDDPETLVGMWRGYQVRIQLHFPSRSRRGMFSIALYTPNPVTFPVTFHREGAFDRIGKATGLSREVQTGDAEFDSQVYVDCENSEEASSYLGNFGVRQQILALLRHPDATVSICPTHSEMTLHYHLGWGKNFKPTVVEEILSQFMGLAESAPHVTSQYRGIISEPRAVSASPAQTVSFAGRPVLIVVGVMALLGPFVFMWGIHYQPVTWRLHLWGLTLAGIAAVIVAPALFKLIQGRSDAHRHFARMMFFFLLTLPMFFVGALKVTNGLFDDGPHYIVPGEVVSHLRKGRRLEIWINLPGHSGMVNVDATRDLYLTTQRGQVVPVFLHPGALKEPWVVPRPLGTFGYH